MTELNQSTVRIIVGQSEVKDLFHEACTEMFQVWHENTEGGRGRDHVDWVELVSQMDGAERQLRVLLRAEGLLTDDFMNSLSIVKNHFTEKGLALVNSFRD